MLNLSFILISNSFSFSVYRWKWLHLFDCYALLLGPSMHSRASLIRHDGKRSTSSNQHFALDVFVAYSFFPLVWSLTIKYLISCSQLSIRKPSLWIKNIMPLISLNTFVFQISFKLFEESITIHAITSGYFLRNSPNRAGMWIWK